MKEGIRQAGWVLFELRHGLFPQLPSIVLTILLNIFGFFGRDR